MNVKIFKNPSILPLEHEINEWLTNDGRNLRIKEIKQSQSYSEAFGEHLVVISVWYI